MPHSPDLDDDERATLVAVLWEVIERNRYFMSPRVKRLRAILDKLEPPTVKLAQGWASTFGSRNPMSSDGSPFCPGNKSDRIAL
jgi:hypothetical protein